FVFGAFGILSPASSIAAVQSSPETQSHARFEETPLPPAPAVKPPSSPSPRVREPVLSPEQRTIFRQRVDVFADRYKPDLTFAEREAIADAVDNHITEL